jgi:hypothetical protein
LTVVSRGRTLEGRAAARARRERIAAAQVFIVIGWVGVLLVVLNIFDVKRMEKSIRWSCELYF